MRAVKRMGAVSFHHIVALAFALLIGGMLWSGFASEAEARPRILRPGSKPGSYEGGIGGDFYLGRGAIGGGGALLIHNSLGFHFNGDSSGPALGGDFDMYISDGFGFAIGPRFWWDISIADMSIYISPFVRPAFVLNITNAGNAYPIINIKFGVRAKIILNDIGILFFEPVGVNINIWPGVGVFANYTLLFGGGVTF